jgi:hypothetical protein
MTEMNKQEMELQIQDAHASKLERDRISSAKYYQEHKAEILEKKKLYQLEHADKIAESNKAYYDENKKEMLIKEKNTMRITKKKYQKEKRLKLNADVVAIIIYQQKQDMKELKNIWSIMSLLSTLVNLLSTLATKTRVNSDSEFVLSTCRPCRLKKIIEGRWMDGNMDI